MKISLRKYLGGDRVIWVIILFLSIYSLLSVYSSSGILVFRNPGTSPAHFIAKHTSFLFAGLIIIYFIHRVPYRYFSKLSQILLIIAIPLLVVTLFFGEDINRASRWLEIPLLGMSFQPSDFAKLALIMYVARVLSHEQDNIEDFYKAFLPIIIPVGIVCLLILPENLSTSLILFATCVILMFTGRIRTRYLVILFLVGIIALGSYVTVVMLTEREGRVGTWEKRIENFFDKDTEDYQVEQAKIAIASGGLFGKFPGNSTQRNFLPHPYSDFIYAVIIEEYGLLLGGIPILLLYLILLYRAGVLLRKSNRAFPAFLAIGLTVGLVLQALIHMAVAVNLLPVTGQPLPMISMGGTSMMFTCISFGMILSVSKGLEEPVQNEEQEQEHKE
jgi:cell division protein FtsW